MNEISLDFSQIRTNFGQKLTSLIDDYKITTTPTSPCSLWILNEILIPISSGENNIAEKSGGLKHKYMQPHNYANSSSDSISLQGIKGRVDQNLTFNTNSTHLSQPLNFKTTHEFIEASNHIHTYFAYNQQCAISVPLVVLPYNEAIECTLENQPVKNTVQIEKSENGDLKNIDMFINWLHLFSHHLNLINASQPLTAIHRSENIPTSEKTPATIFIINSHIFFKISNLIQSAEKYQQLTSFLEQQNMYILTYPLEKVDDQINVNIFNKFVDLWKNVLVYFSMKENPNNDLTFIYMYKQCLRKLIFGHKGLVRESFNKLTRLYQLHMDLFDETLLSVDEAYFLANGGVTIQTTSNGFNYEHDAMMDEDISEEAKRNDVKLSDLSDMEIDEYVQWTEEMSKIGCLCIKYTFLRDIYLKCKFLYVEC